MLLDKFIPKAAVWVEKVRWEEVSCNGKAFGILGWGLLLDHMKLSYYLLPDNSTNTFRYLLKYKRSFLGFVLISD